MHCDTHTLFSHVFLHVLNFVVCLCVCETDPGHGHPLHPEEHKEESRRQGLAMVEADDHSQTPDRGAAD